MNIFCPIINITKPEFSGKLLIDGNFQNNRILFRFLFDTLEMMHPLIITIKVHPIATLGVCLENQYYQNERIFVFKCNIPDLNNLIMKSHLLIPDFLLDENKIEIINIESQVSCHVID